MIGKILELWIHFLKYSVLLVLLLIAILAFNIYSCRSMQGVLHDPSDKDIRKRFDDIEIILPDNMQALSVERIDGLKGNYVGLTLKLAATTTAKIRNLLTDKVIPSQVDGDECPWYFTEEKNSETITIEGRQFYD